MLVQLIHWCVIIHGVSLLHWIITFVLDLILALFTSRYCSSQEFLSDIEWSITLKTSLPSLVSRINKFQEPLIPRAIHITLKRELFPPPSYRSCWNQSGGRVNCLGSPFPPIIDRTTPRPALGRRPSSSLQQKRRTSG